MRTIASLVIVRDMWLTGFDAPPVHTLYVDKPMQGHGLMQASHEPIGSGKDKPGGLIVDYIGNRRGIEVCDSPVHPRCPGQEREPVDTSGETLRILLDTLDVLRREFFHGFDYSGFGDAKRAHLALLGPAMEHVLQVDPEPDDKAATAV